MRVLLTSLAALLLTACQTASTARDAMPPPEPQAAAIGELAPLPSAVLVDGRLFLPPPPAPGSSADRADLAIAQGPWTQERTEQARQDNAIDAFAAFDNVLGPEFNSATLPATARLFAHVSVAAGAASMPVKALYGKDRPFVRLEGHPTCIDAEALRTNGSYPSGHSSIGFAWGLTLAELLPARATALIARGVDFGQSRVVCGVHWQSDVDSGRTLGAAVFARLQSDEAFQTELAAARAELVAAYPN